VSGSRQTCPGSSDTIRKRSAVPARCMRSVLRAFSLWVILALLAAQACALPINLGFAFLRGDEDPVTEGCERKTCCTAFCYLDKNGVHHCVHETNDSSQCGVSTNELKNNPILPLPNVVLPKAEALIPDLLAIEWIPQTPVPVETCDIIIPSPPPK
jgi:hypothetical protein